MPEPADQPAKPLGTWRPMALWTAGILLALGLAWFIGAVVVPIWQMRAVMVALEAGNFDAADRLDRLGPPERVVQKLGLYLRLPDRIAPNKYWAAVSLSLYDEDAFPEMIRAFDNPAANVRAVVLDKLREKKLPKEQLEPLVARGLADPDYTVRLCAVQALADSDLKIEVPPEALAAGLRLGGDGRVRIECARRLGDMGAKAAFAVSALITALDDENGQARANVAGALSQIGEAARPAIPRLVRCLEDADEAVRLNAVVALARIACGERQLGMRFEGRRGFWPSFGGGQFGYRDGGQRVRSVLRFGVTKGAVPARAEGWPVLDKQAISALAKVLNNSSDDSVRLDAAALLGALGPNAAEALPALGKTLEAGGAGARINALWAIWMIRQDPPWPELEALLADKDPVVRGEAVWLLGLLGADHPRLGPALEKVSVDPAGDVRLAAARLHLMAKRDAAAVLPILTGILNDAKEQEYTRAGAVGELGRLGAAGQPALPAVEAHLADGSEQVRIHAALAHWRITGARERAIKVLLSALESQDSAWLAARTLGEMGPAAAEAIPTLERIVQRETKNTGDREAAASALKKIRGQEPPK